MFTVERRPLLPVAARKAALHVADASFECALRIASAPELIVEYIKVNTIY
jgi:hypothetical protein